MNQKTFDLAVEIAHSQFWVADSEQVTTRAKREISKITYWKDDELLLARYAVMICHCALLEEQRAARKSKTKGKKRDEA